VSVALLSQRIDYNVFVSPSFQRPAMNAAQMLQLMNRIPFEPFELHLNDGHRIRVDHPSYLATREDSPTCIICDDDEQMRIVAYRNIAEVITKATAD
jgi:hypothetical protein